MPYPLALALTLVIEVPLAIWLGGRLGVGQRRAAAVAAIASLTSHPLLWFAVYPWLDDTMGALPAVLVAEALVVAWEAVVWRVGARVSVVDAIALAGATNAASFGLGVLLGLALP